MEPGAAESPKAKATTISKVKGMITSFQRYREVLQTKAALIKKLWWRAAICKVERHSAVDPGADCKRLEKEAADEVAIGVDRTPPCPWQFQRRGCPKQ